MPIVRDAELLGVVSEADIIERERGPDTESESRLGRHLHLHQRKASAYATTAEEAMTSPPLTVDAWMSAYEAAWMMSVHDVARLPVIDRG